MSEDHAPAVDELDALRALIAKLDDLPRALEGDIVNIWRHEPNETARQAGIEVADYAREWLTDVVKAIQAAVRFEAWRHCGRGPCCKEDAHEGQCAQ